MAVSKAQNTSRFTCCLISSPHSPVHPVVRGVFHLDHQPAGQTGDGDDIVLQPTLHDADLIGAVRLTDPDLPLGDLHRVGQSAKAGEDKGLILRYRPQVDAPDLLAAGVDDRHRPFGTPGGNVEDGRCAKEQDTRQQSGPKTIGFAFHEIPPERK